MFPVPPVAMPVTGPEPDLMSNLVNELGNCTVVEDAEVTEGAVIPHPKYGTG